MLRKLRSAFLLLDPADRRLVMRAAVWMVCTRLSLWVLPYGTTRRLVDRVGHGSGPGASPPLRVAWAVEALGDAVPVLSCLVQATAAEVMLRRAGERPTLHLGVAASGEQRIEAHAWLEWNDRVIVGNRDLGRYSSMDRS